MTQKTLIWDIPLRIFHWTLVCLLAGSWYTSGGDGDLIENHMILGYSMLALLIFRILWGVLGTKHARFSQFIPSFRSLLAYIRDLKKGRSAHTAGHNPLGALMVILMIMLLSMQAISGLFIDDDVFSAGPYNGSVGKDIVGLMAFIHHNVFDVIVGAVVIHLVAIGYYAAIKKVNLVLPMITGKKPADTVNKSDIIHTSRLWLAVIIAIITVAFVYWLVIINAPVTDDYY
ncbi:MAG: cytochrome b [Phenylobacterium sp.]|jgi:cytochrome b